MTQKRVFYSLFYVVAILLLSLAFFVLGRADRAGQKRLEKQIQDDEET